MYIVVVQEYKQKVIEKAFDTRAPNLKRWFLHKFPHITYVASVECLDEDPIMMNVNAKKPRQPAVDAGGNNTKPPAKKKRRVGTKKSVQLF